MGAVHGRIAPAVSAEKHPGEWQHVDVTLYKRHLTVALNGVKIIEYDRNNQMWDALVGCSKYKVWPNFGNAEEGHILLQDHGDEVWFKNVKIKVLP